MYNNSLGQTNTQKAHKIHNQAIRPTQRQEQLFYTHHAIAISIASKYRNIPGLDIEDVHQHAQIALWEAVSKFREDRNVKFSTFAWKVIHNRLNTLYHKQCRITSREQPTHTTSASDSTTSENPLENQPCEQSPCGAQKLIRKEETRLLKLAIQKLPHRSQTVIQGIMANQTYREIGQNMGFSQASSKTLVSRAWRQALQTLRAEFRDIGYPV